MLPQATEGPLECAWKQLSGLRAAGNTQLRPHSVSRPFLRQRTGAIRHDGVNLPQV